MDPRKSDSRDTFRTYVFCANTRGEQKYPSESMD